MITLFNNEIADYLPSSLQDEGKRVLDKLASKLDDVQLKRLIDEMSCSSVLSQQLVRTLVGSEYVLESCCRNPGLLFHWLLTDIPFSPLTPIKIIDAVETACSDELTVEELDSLLRRLRQQFMTGLYWRDLNGLADFSEVSHAMTTMAEVFVQQALDFHYKVLVKRYGLPIGKVSQQPQPMLVIGMGKLGGNELNVSSDIDLIFAFPEAGETQNKTKSIDNQTFFIQLGQRVIKTLNETTFNGFVFRVDMRLRPYGESGALASNFAALENYYETQGRDWERFAAVKARVIACSRFPQGAFDNSFDGSHSEIISVKIEQESTEEFYKILQPFTYRKYIDFSTVESLRKLKAMIVQEVRRKGLQDDVKLGAGGIREIEFIAQSFQLIRGGRDARLRERNLLTVLQQLSDLKNLSKKIVDKLSAAYLFLRKTEHAIQAFQDAQTQRLPVDDLQCERLAWVMGFDGWPDFYEQLNEHRKFVDAEFQKVIADPDSQDVEKLSVSQEWESFWEELDSKPFSQTIGSDEAIGQNVFPSEQLLFLKKQGFSQPESSIKALSSFKQCRKVMSLSATARKKLDIFIPQLLSSLTHAELSVDASDLLLRLLNWLETIVTRTSYVLLLLENPQVLKHLIQLFAASSWVTETLTKIPSLLDELLSPETLYSLPEKSSLRDELRQRLLRFEPDDVEGHMEMLRYFRLAHNLHVAACEITGSLPLMKVSDYLTFTAEVVLEQVLVLAWRDLVRRHGYPEGASDEFPQFLVVGYGKLGGIEMSYSSDLDLVFIYEAAAQGMTNGERPIDHQTFYTRLGQKMIHILNTRTMSGQLYEVDMRLRPSGNSGLLVSSITAFSRYQNQEAWIWEHQALVRARPVAGDKQLAMQFMALRKEVLSRSRTIDELKEEVVNMREKMRNHLGTSPKSPKNSAETSEFHLKQDAGGIVDIEFMVQYAVLAWSSEQPSLSEWTDNIRILETLRTLGLIDIEQADQLIAIYQFYRMHSHRLALQQDTSSVIESGDFTEQREQVKALWNYFFS